MSRIKQLTASVVNKIAAGEVVERPASVVKELMENSIDAGATRIDVAVAQGGAESIRIADNGCGIAPDQFTLALSSHATSKIENADDLFRVGTLGFRGEALASIAEISQLCMSSREASENSGMELEVIGGKHGALSPCGMPPGTTIEVRNLFFNTPVRRKFMRTTQTEMARCSEAFTRIALAKLNVHFTLRHNGRTVYDLPPVSNWADRISTLFGADLASALLPVAAAAVDEQDGVSLYGLAANPTIHRSHNRMQYLFLNGRHIRDRALHHALGEAYRGLLLHGRFPVAFIHISMPPEAIDVNVHPTKMEVRFRDSGRVYSRLLGALRKKFLASDLTPRVGGAEPETPASETEGLHDQQATAEHRRELVDWARGQLAEKQPEESRQLRFDETTPSFSPAPTTGLVVTRLDRNWSAPPAGRAQGGPPPSEHSFDAPPDAQPPPPAARTEGAAMQVLNRYLVVENEEGVVVIDQHALHERILYEQIRQQVLNGKVETQRLLVPEPVHMTPEEASIALESRALLAELGIEVEPFGGDTVVVSSYPAMLANINPAELLRQLVDQLLEGGKKPDRRDLLDELLHMISCKAAIKAGDRLTPEEVHALIEQRGYVQDSHHCPHGRPTSLVFTREELDRRFQRT